MRKDMDIYEVYVKDEQYDGQSAIYHGLAKDIGAASEAGLELFRQQFKVAKKEAPIRP